MKLSVMQENLARGLQVVSRAVSSRSTLPVLANVLLRTEDAGLKLTATNLEIGITYWVPGKIETEGSLTVPARLITDVVDSLPPGERVDLESDGAATLDLRCGRQRAHLRGIDADEFPVIPSAGERPTTRISQRALKQALSEVVFAAASDEARPILTGVLTRFEGDRLTLAAADNYRIAVKTLTTACAGRGDLDRRPGPLVPRARSACWPTATIPSTSSWRPSKNQIVFHLEGIDLVSRLIDGQFPNYQQVLPTSHTTRAVVDREELLKAVRLSALIASSSANVVRLRVDAEGESRASPWLPPPTSVTPRATSTRPPRASGLTVAFNARYLQEALHEPGGRAAGARIPGPALPGRAQADRRRRLRARHHAGPHAVLSGGPADRITLRVDQLSLTGFRSYADPRASVRRGPAGRRRRQRGRQDQPDRSHRAARAR